LDFEFATTIDVKTWDEPRVLVKASAQRHEGLDDEAYELDGCKRREPCSVSSPAPRQGKAVPADGLRPAIRWHHADGKGLKIKEYYEVYVPRNAQTEPQDDPRQHYHRHNNGPWPWKLSPAISIFGAKQPTCRHYRQKPSRGHVYQPAF
jgi:hypothetical protein